MKYERTRSRGNDHSGFCDDDDEDIDSEEAVEEKLLNREG